ncbi:TPA: hypothetical protein HA235_04820 [Candidatus Woesearchaeota archaeon]|nr:hypothetical protein [Candidatus Woesearchaeota archaeon]HIH32003.1 hypothetical protein [Candidatus Woesearchaeota archaeon]HIH54881.1 hypothetical protein [Candidatus Woesearchaeota archaeon]HIJ02022.1 hypothetical protein [Candidatus Woesearchaeota archaeon]HIJ13283.1 hypothetical protein [Candidatus Woesearchaeota archaeon]
MENSKIDQEINVDEKIEQIFRAMHSKIIMLYDEYNSINNMLSEEKDSIKTLEKFHFTILGIRDSLDQEINLINNLKATIDLNSVRKITSKIIENINLILEWVKEYDKELKSFKEILGSNNNALIKKYIETEYSKLTLLYNKIFTEDNEVIRELNMLKKIAA